MEHITGAPHICLSGGAPGADLEWGTHATIIGHKVIHWSFDGHPSTAPPEQLIRLTDEQLAVSHEALVKAATFLGKSPPKRAAVSSLLQRNYYQVAWSNSCYAVGYLDDGMVQGGTGWAVAMFIQLHPDSRDLYVFDQVEGAWFQWDGANWDPIHVPPRPTGIWAGIGSRGLNQAGKMAIEEVMHH